MNKQNIKWIAVQPLTGGFYLGAEDAIGNSAKAIISFPGLNEVKYDKDGNPTSVSNEHYLKTYLEKHGRMPEYHTFKHNMFDKDNYEDGDIDITFENVDLVIGLPVCSGLSMATTTASKETRDTRNNNMKYIAHYVLTQVKPKVYIFENAPTFMGNQGNELREWFQNLAKEEGYSILYYKTDSTLHENCQRRPRTFIIFTKTKNAIKLPWENSHIDTKEFFNKMLDSEYNNDLVSTTKNNHLMIKFVNKKWGKEWRNEIDNGCPLKHLMSNDLIDEYLEFIKDSDEFDKIKNYIEHAQYKLSIGKNYYSSDVFIPDEYQCPAVQFRSIPMMLHPIEDRMCTYREFLNLMGMPSDFEWYGSEGNYPKIGQNVPVKTAKFIVNETIKAIQDNIYHENSIVYQDNIKQKTTIIE